MGVEFDPAWEYWEPDPEIAWAAGGGRCDPSDALPVCEDSRTGRRVLDGFRVAKDPNWLPAFRLAPERPERPDRLPLRRCGACPRLFTPKARRQRYCSSGCAPRAAPLPCAWCGTEFRPAHWRQRTCGRGCGVLLSGSARRGKPLGRSPLRGRPLSGAGRVPLDWGRFADLHAAGLSARQIAGREGVSKTTVTHALKCLGVYRPGKPGRPKRATA